MQQNTSQARIIDPVLSEVALGYRQPAGFVADYLFPIVPVNQRGGSIIVFGVDDFVLVNTQRSPGENTKRVQFGRSSGTYALTDFSLEGVVPNELQEEASSIGLDEAAMAIRRVQNKMNLERESDAAALARNPANYAATNKITLAGSDQFQNALSDPFAIVNAAKEAVRKQIGFRPNLMVIGPVAVTALSMHPKVLDRKSNQNDRTPASLAELQRLFEVSMVVDAGAIAANTTGIYDVWGGDIILAYVDKVSATDMGSPNYGYTYQLRGYPFVEEPYQERNTKSMIYPVTDARKPVLTGASAGYLITNAAV
jgi:hypothetical protein